MTSETERLEREIALERVELAENLAALEVRARELTDWRWQVRHRPLAAVGVAMAGGVLLAAMTGPRAPRGRRGPDAGDDRAVGPSLLSHPIIARLVAALAVVAAERAAETLGELIPGLTRAMDDAPPPTRPGA